MTALDTRLRGYYNNYRRFPAAFSGGCSSSGRAPPCHGGGSGFEPRHPLQQAQPVKKGSPYHGEPFFVCGKLCPAFSAAASETRSILLSGARDHKKTAAFAAGRACVLRLPAVGEPVLYISGFYPDFPRRHWKPNTYADPVRAGFCRNIIRAKSSS